MCIDPWDESISQFAVLYLDAIRESNNWTRTPQHRHIWAGKAQSFGAGYADKLQELDNEELGYWIENLDELYDGLDRDALKDPAVAEQKRRADEGALAA